jgi:hypothetical protein
MRILRDGPAELVHLGKLGLLHLFADQHLPEGGDLVVDLALGATLTKFFFYKFGNIFAKKT